MGGWAVVLAMDGHTSRGSRTAALALALLVGVSGCSIFGDESPDRESTVDEYRGRPSSNVLTVYLIHTGPGDRIVDVTTTETTTQVDVVLTTNDDFPPDANRAAVLVPLWVQVHLDQPLRDRVVVSKGQPVPEVSTGDEMTLPTSPAEKTAASV